MRTILPALVAVCALSACTTSTTSDPTPSSTSMVAPAVAGDQGLPFDAMPDIPTGRNELVPCPYLDSQWVADTNGQRVLGSGIDERFDHPACVFWSYAEEEQLTVMVRTMASESDAEQVVNWAAPIDTTEPADLPAGWMGGRLGSPGRSLYAVYKDNKAVVVFTNQDQSLKAQLVAEETIKNLGL
ncbi:hypothetical protein CKALI_11570 [Corynebacterium kalinowskii]|uniref:DUF2020 domain-containing protein n=1 Tax=Corynebacterium kalinowskii TaxID=2675216 RepID=A0A6B8VWS5_9CORY|nr:DUF2020 domain-containing protein [Corynebacterium kalinowskii]QGU03156.1 hypothetical protein CKALI_11570 [Corynebacterium kalinowskii]